MKKNEIRKTQNEIRQLVRKIRSGLGDKTKNEIAHNVYNQLVLAVNQMNYSLLKIAISLLRNKRLLSDKEFIKLRSSLYLFSYSIISVIINDLLNKTVRKMPRDRMGANEGKHG